MAAICPGGDEYYGQETEWRLYFFYICVYECAYHREPVDF